jgi:hypothetical protein
VLLLVAAGCGPLGPSADDMREAAESLVPPGSRIVAREDRDCVQLADSPSCHVIRFVGPAAPLDARAATVRELARRAGWEDERQLRTEGATFLEYSRDGLDVDVSLWTDSRAVPCRARPQPDCADSVRVVR